MSLRQQIIDSMDALEGVDSATYFFAAWDEQVYVICVMRTDDGHLHFYVYPF